MADHPGVVYAQSAAIPYRMGGRRLEFLLIRNRSNKRWIVPKGIIEEWQTPEEAALDEAFEEAGVEGIIVGGAVGAYEYRKWGGTCHVEVFLLHVETEHDAWPESFRERKWVVADEALNLVDNPDLRGLIQNAAGFIEGGEKQKGS